MLRIHVHMCVYSQLYILPNISIVCAHAYKRERTDLRAISESWRDDQKSLSTFAHPHHTLIPPLHHTHTHWITS